MGNVCSPYKLLRCTHNTEPTEVNVEKEDPFKKMEIDAKNQGLTLQRSVSGSNLPTVDESIPSWNGKNPTLTEIPTDGITNGIAIPPLKVREVPFEESNSRGGGTQFITVRKPVCPPSPELKNKKSIENSSEFKTLLDPSLTEEEVLLLKALNKARTNPNYYIRYIKKMLKYYHSDETFLFPKAKVKLATHEGKDAYQEAIFFLEGLKPIPELVLSVGMTLAARDLVADHGPRNMGAHVGSDRSTVDTRLNFYGTWRGTCGENCGYGLQLGEHIIAKLIADDGVPDRGHRKNIFNSEFRKVGLATGPHYSYGRMCVIDFAGKYIEDVSKQRQLKIHRRRLLYFFIPGKEESPTDETKGEAGE